MNHETFASFFEAATGRSPFLFQRRFAESRDLHHLVSVPTGLGKTAMVVLGWLWRRRYADPEIRATTPRRLVYCLPMRVLVEQMRDCALDWLDALALLSGTLEREPGENDERGRVKAETYRPDRGANCKIPVHALMGGEEAHDWDMYPEQDAILVGTQDMLLSRALNRGYGMSRSRWPLAFGLLNTDCLWIFDEIQLMGTGLATTAQLQAFRSTLPNRESPQAKSSHGCQSVWMSATMEQNWLRTVDFDPSPLRLLQLETDDLKDREIRRRYDAAKPLSKASAAIGDSEKLAAEVIEQHRRFKGITLVVVNTVKRARDLYAAIEKAIKHAAPKEAKGKKQEPAIPGQPEIVLLHSRFRPLDRKAKIEKLLTGPAADGTICVSTQVVEAGVDVSATTLFTELAPWASLVQRFGRCNRRGDDTRARIWWIDLAREEKKAKDAARPYELTDLAGARDRVDKCQDVGSSRLPTAPLLFEHTHVIRRKDVIDLFDTTPDLAGNDIDIDRYVRDVEETDVQVFWREWDGNSSHEEPKRRHISREEICAAPIGEFREFVKNRRATIWRWDFLDGEWVRTDSNSVYPGQTYWVRVDAGGYSPDHGWNPEVYDRVQPVYRKDSEIFGPASDSTGEDLLSQLEWQTISMHTDHVCAELQSILRAITLSDCERHALERAARWHDWGKAHDVFQNAIDDGQAVTRFGEKVPRLTRPQPWQGCRVVAKAPERLWRHYDWLPGEGRKHFRHELASALGVLKMQRNEIPADLRDLVAYLVAAHHGKVRLSIRSLPGEKKPGNGLRFARGIWDKDKLPATDLGDKVSTPETELSLELMELGCSSNGQPSWTERVLLLRDKSGPFWLAYLEALLRAADMRASANGMKEKRS